MRAWEKNIRRIEPYVPGEQPNQPDMIKLNTNENPYPPSPGVRKILSELDTDILRLYPDPTAEVLTQALAENYHVKKEQVFVGVGSDDVLAMAFLTFFNSGKPILFPDITYSFYDVWANLYRIPFNRPPLTEDFRIRVQDYKQENGGIVIANPNAPTGIAEDPEFIEQILQANQDVIVIVDEAYVDFGAKSCLHLLDRYENLLVVQTFSKSRSMAGARIGFAIGNPVLIQALQDIKYSYNSYTMNQVSLIAGAAAVRDKIYFRETTERIVQTRERTKRDLRELGFTFPDSKTNFIFAAHKTAKARDLFGKLRERHIYVRHFSQPRIENYLRITVGTEQEMDLFLKMLRIIL